MNLYLFLLLMFALGVCSYLIACICIKIFSDYDPDTWFGTILYYFVETLVGITYVGIYGSIGVTALGIILLVLREMFTTYD